MEDKFKQRRKRIDLVKEIEKIHIKAEELNKTATILDDYCKAFKNQSEHIYNLSSITKFLARQSEDLFRNLCKVLDTENPAPVPEFMKNMKPFAEQIVDYDDE